MASVQMKRRQAERRAFCTVPVAVICMTIACAPLGHALAGPSPTEGHAGGEPTRAGGVPPSEPLHWVPTVALQAWLGVTFGIIGFAAGARMVTAFCHHSRCIGPAALAGAVVMVLTEVFLIYAAGSAAGWQTKWWSTAAGSVLGVVAAYVAAMVLPPVHRSEIMFVGTFALGSAATAVLGYHLTSTPIDPPQAAALIDVSSKGNVNLGLPVVVLHRDERGTGFAVPLFACDF